MKKIILLIIVLSATFEKLSGQETQQDSIMAIAMEEIVVLGSKPGVARTHSKSLASLDEYLEKASKINMIKRGAYAWEPAINNMATERTVITIDGMRIFSACTDKMDPVTSYVEISNLQEATISSGQQGSEYGATIGGGIDLKRRKTGFRNAGWKTGVNTGIESSGEQKIAGGELGYSGNDFYFNTDIMYRDAENYFAGGSEEVLYSQFKKVNFSAISGIKLSAHKTLETSLIFDRATDVGYAALPMDVSLARAVIGSLMYEHHMPTENIEHWETKIYFNTVKHKMDDTGRPDVAIRMDMPGWSDTYGYYSKLKFGFGKHKITTNLNGFYNSSLAEMTMHPIDQGEAKMFMYTWPDVRTAFTGMFVEDLIVLNPRLSLQLTATLGTHFNEPANEEGLAGLQIFYPNMERQTLRLLPGTSAQLQILGKRLSYTVGAGYGERAPSVSEGYGFYIFNSFDGFDYIGNPGMSNERSYEMNASAGYKFGKWNARVSSNYFYIKDYIIGRPVENYSPMTIGANGIKLYEQLEFASIINTDFTLGFDFNRNLKWNGALMWSYGIDDNGINLPMIQPFTYNTTLQYRNGAFLFESGLTGAGKQVNYSPEYGENLTEAYYVVNLSAARSVFLKSHSITVKMGAENILDTWYSTYSSWNNIPGRGRNFFLNLRYEL